MTLYTQVSANRARTWLFMGIYTILLMLVAYAAAYYFDNYGILFIAGIICIVQGWVSYYFSDKIALAVSGAQLLERPGNEKIFRVMENLCITAGLEMPKIYLIPDSAMNAFATGRDTKNASIAVTAGLVQNLDDNELAGVLAHELSHVGNEDIKLMSMVMVMAGLIALLSDWMLRSVIFGRRRNDSEGGGNYLIIVALVLAILAPIASTLIQLAISRKREFMADADAVLLTRYPQGLIGALRKISGDTEPLEVANRATAHLYFSNPLKPSCLMSLLSTHPSIEDRITALEKGSGMRTESESVGSAN